MSSALSHLRILDLSRILAGPWASQILGDLGAEVIKVENPNGGDDTRQWGPPFIDQDAGVQMAAYFACANRNKKSLTLNIAHAQGQALLHRLVAVSDVFIENYKVGDLQRYRLDYEALRAINPRLIYCSITGFGQTGPRATQAGYDFMIQGIGGLMSVTGVAQDQAESEPMKVGVALVDVLTGLYSSNAILAALMAREQTGRGQHIDMALFDVQVASLANQSLNYLVSGNAPKRMGNAHPNIVPYQAFATQDGNMILAVGNDKQFARFCGLAGHDEVAQDARFSSNTQRIKHRAELIPILNVWMRERTTGDWLALLEQAQIPCGPINTIDQVFAEPQAQARQLQQEFIVPQLGSVPTVANPIRLSDTPTSYRLPPPQLGEHSVEILRDLLNLNAKEITQLQTQKVI